MRTQLAVTIDFHDTLFVCDEWFTLEVHELVPAFLAWHEREVAGIDWNATLVHCDGDGTDLLRRHYRELRAEIMQHGNEMDAEACVIETCRRVGITIEEASVATGIEHVMRETLATARPRDGVVDLVRDLRRSGVRLGIISNAVYHPFLIWALQQHGLASSFDVVTTSASAGYYKTRPEIYLQTLEALDAQPVLTMHLGDSYRFDVLGARRAGMKTGWLDLKGEAGSDTPADLITPTLSGIAPRVLQILSGNQTL